MGWGTDTRLYTTSVQFRRELPQCLAEGEQRVLKQDRGNGGIGVWKVEAVDPGAPVARVRVRHALREFFQGDGRIIDQVYQPRLSDRIVRCYGVRDRLAGVGKQLDQCAVSGGARCRAGRCASARAAALLPADAPHF